MDDYKRFLDAKRQCDTNAGFPPLWMPDCLYDFQQHLVDWAIRKGRAAIFADCGLGKGQLPEAPILTPVGFIPMGSLIIGDDVIASDGKAYKVTGVYKRPLQDVYRVRYSDGAEMVVDESHLHICRTNNDRQRDRSWRVMSTRDLLECDNLRYGANGKSRNYDIPVVNPVEFSCTHSSIDPYVIGVLLGDGGTSAISQVAITSADPPLIERVNRLLAAWDVRFENKEGYEYRLKSGITGSAKHPFRQILYRLGIMGKHSYDKEIPREYLYAASPLDRLELLRGLMDTDGYIAKGGTSQFYSTSKVLAESVVTLIRSLGGIPTLSTKAAYLNGVRHRDCHIATFSLATYNPFHLARKAERWNPSPRDNGRWIDSLEYAGKAETICISVASPDESYVTESFVVTHNTPMQLVWAENVVRKTNKPVLILTPLAVSQQTVREGEKFGIECIRSQDGKVGNARIVVTNYERLHYFEASEFAGVVCDESSILKSFNGQTRKRITRFMCKHPYRLLCTATAAPNDYVELGTSSEALGALSHSEMLKRFFQQLDDKGQKRERKQQEDAEALLDIDPNYYRKLAYRVAQTIGQWRLKHHAIKHFWRWVASWAMACRKPSDLGFNDDRFILPSLNERDHVIIPDSPPPGKLFNVSAIGLREERVERKRTLMQRCGFVRELVDHDRQAVIWCHMNAEGDMLEDMIDDAEQVAGRTPDERKIELYEAFQHGDIRVLVIKPKIGAWGLNWQHCNHIVTFASHSYEQYYQSVRRCWRFGQTRPVDLDVIATEGEIRVLGNMRRKAKQADSMFTAVVKEMHNAERIARDNGHIKKEEVPGWLYETN